MPVLKILANGGTVSVGHQPGAHERAKRGEVQGWTPRASRGNRDFLWSVIAPDLDGDGYAVTLTMRECPPDSDRWHRLRRAWIERLRRIGMLRLHWVTEWQRRGVPHLHAAVWFPEGTNLLVPENFSEPCGYVLRAWMQVAAEFGTGWHGQHARKITGVTGWFEYLAKHAARGVSNYQRSSEGIPEGWKKTGRMWGHVGQWPRRESVEIQLNDAGFYRLRRIWVGYQIARARERGDWYRVRYLRNYLQADQEVSKCRGMGEWASQDFQLSSIAAVAMRDDVEVSC